MRQTAAGLNRGWLAVLGLILVLGGLLGLGIGTGQADRLLALAGVSLPLPDPRSPVFGGGWDAGWVAPVVAAAGVIVALLPLAWLMAQIPRTNQAKQFRLQDSADTGQTWCEPKVLSDAVEAHTATLAGVQSAAAVVRGTAEHPEVTIKVTATDRADIARLVGQISTTVAGGVGTALDTRLARLGVQVEISRTSTSTDKITV